MSTAGRSFREGSEAIPTLGTMAPIPFRAVASLILCFLWAASHAQDIEPYEPDPPGRAARLAYTEGEISMQPSGLEDWTQAIVNRPLTTGDKLWSEPGARAEIQVGPAAVRLGGSTGFSFLNVDDDTIQMRMTAGVINVSVRTLRDSEQIEIATPNVALSLLRPGNYRVEVNDAGDTTVVKVSEGAVQATGSSQDIVVHAQQVVTFSGFDDLDARHATLGAPDEFDSWSLERDRNYERVATSRTAEYVSPDVTGYEDLEDNGSWSSEAEYGYVWTPRYVAADWAPYRYGRWVSISPWGWTWIDDARWGYAPFHYGRWAHIRNRWCWVPGPRHVRAVYAPALVGWGGSHSRNVGWYPLGPREYYSPGRRFSRHYLERVNYSNTNLSRAHFNRGVADGVRDAIYRNRRAPGGVTAVSRDVFTSAGRAAAHREHSTEQELARGQSSGLAPRIAPVLASRLGGPTRANVRVPPSSIANRQVVVRRDPPSAAARYARRPQAERNPAIAQADRPARAPVRGQDRPPRANRPVSESAPHSSVFEPRAIADRVRVDRERQVRGTQAQREIARQQREQRPVDAVRRATERQMARPERPVQRERSPEPTRAERPVQRQRNPEPARVERPRAERPQQVERPRRTESPRPAESRSPPRGRQDSNTRPNRN